MATEKSDTRSSRYSHKNEPPMRNGKKKHGIIKIFLSLIFILFIGLLAGTGLFVYYAHNAPGLSDTRLNATTSSKLYDMNNEVFEDLGAEKRELIQPNDIPQLLKNSITSVEDRRFYKHAGVDPIRIAGSAFSNLKHRSSGLQGGSTLTQQLIKLTYFSTKDADKNFKRKAQEAWLALQLEKKKSKEEILTYYINKVYMANGLYGMETAAENYYGKSLNELSLPQTALLAGMPQAPNEYNPYTHKDHAKERRDTVLYTMLDNKKISQQEYDQAKETPIDDGLKPLKTSSNDRQIVDNYVKEVIDEVQKKTGKNVYTDGLNIYTNLDMKAQKRLYDIVNTDNYVQYPDNDFQVASTAIDVKTGQVRAQIGGRKFPENSQLNNNLAVNTSRDVGSTMKPMIDYGPAIEYLNYSTGIPLKDQPTTYSSGTPVFNSDFQYYGPITMRKAIMRSRNTTAVQTFKAVGKEKAAEFLKNLGIQFADLNESNAISSNTSKLDLKTNKYGLSSLKLAAAYAAFANQGVYNKPYYVNKVVYKDGSVDEFAPESNQAMSEATAYMMTDMLKDVISGGTAFNAKIPGLIQAGKTGTSNYTDSDMAHLKVTSSLGVAPDSTFVGYTPNYVVSVWTGYKDRMMPVLYNDYGIASSVYREMIQYLSKNVSNIDWKQPNTVIRVGKELYVKGKSTPLPTVSTLPSNSSSSLPIEETSQESKETSSTTSSSTESQILDNDPSESSKSSEPTKSSDEPSEPSAESSKSSKESKPSDSNSPISTSF